ncbi:NAD(P)H-binding protein [Roseibium sp.]|uniref:NAD(P)H-binding protein n=1 Tax=Roseibium sp. TaxID=1936156 RepID=UPI003D0B3471
MTAEKPILIIGGAGKTGRRVNGLLIEKGHATRPVSRSTDPAFDWADPATWDAALAGTRAAYVTYQPDLSVPGAAEAIGLLAEKAKAHGLEHLVLLSGRGEPGAERAEKVLSMSGLDWNVVRASWFAQNFSEEFMAQAIQAGELALPVGPVPEPFIDADDIAEVVTAALTEERLRNRLYEVTGPRALTFAEAIGSISSASGRPVLFRQISTADFEAGMRQAGVPDDMIGLLNELFTEVLDGRNARVAHGVEEALGRPPRDFSSYAAKAAEAGAWES